MRKKKLLSLLGGCAVLTLILATAAIQPAHAGAIFSEESGNFPPVRIGGLRVSYCMESVGCNDYSVQRAAHAFCKYKGYHRSVGKTYYRAPNRKRRDTILYLGGNARDITNWRPQNSKRRWFTNITCR